jgi:putative ABC transport system substrate-binding protein
MRRRDLIALVGGGAVAWPFVARSEQSERVQRLGIMLVNAENDIEGQSRVAAFRNGLQDLGWIEGRNLRIDYRWSAASPERAEASAKELVALAPDAIVVNGTPALAAAHQATKHIPIVFILVVDPVGAGYVKSLAHPGGYITGFSSFEPEIGGKWLELLKQIAPKVRRVAGILDPDFQGFATVWRAIENLGSRFGLVITTLVFRTADDDIESAIASFAQPSDGALIVLPTAINNLHRARIISKAARYRLPAIYPFPLYATSGGLMSYGIDTLDVFRRGASYVDRILKGERPADLPIQAPVKFELIINLKTAKSLDLTIPPTLLATADQVIE